MLGPGQEPGMLPDLRNCWWGKEKRLTNKSEVIGHHQEKKGVLGKGTLSRWVRGFTKQRRGEGAPDEGLGGAKAQEQKKSGG